jgi:DNA (cytosine-5)-methyltransferase 1
VSKRPPIIRAGFEGELVFDGFAGGGGTSTGIFDALGRPPDFAVNHDPEALAMHEANHPDTRHFCESIWEVDPREITRGRRVGFAWFSPDCKHFSRAKGGPLNRSKEIRSQAWVVIRWASLPNRPRVIVVENVEEFLTWGPLGVDGEPIKDRAGETFSEWLTQLQWCGYQVEVKRLVAADYGSPTTRKRLFIVARCDGQPIVWPEATHGAGRALAWRTAAEVIDWSIPCPSIFGRKKPLAEKTMARIARGLDRFVLKSASPFVVTIDHHGSRGPCAHLPTEPLGTITTKARHALVAPCLIQTSYGERKGQAPRILDLHKPLTTIVAAFLTKHFGGHGTPGSPLTRAMDTITAKDHHSLSVAWLEKTYGTSSGADVQAPAPTVTGSGHLAAVRAFLVKFYGTGAAVGVGEPLDTITTKDRFGLVTVDGEDWQIIDIGMRMLQPRELFGAQGFPADYEIAPLYNGKPLTKTAQIRLVGNSVPPQLARALAAENGRAA